MSDHWGLTQEQYDALPHDSRGGVVIAASVACMALATIVVSLRIYTRHFLLNRLWADDILTVAGLCNALATGVVQCMSTTAGLGMHWYDVRSSYEFTLFTKLFYVNAIVYNGALLLIKLSLFFQYYRLIKESPRYSVVYLTVMALVLSWTISQIFVFVFLCWPVQSYWRFDLQGKCLDFAEVAWINAVGNIVTDVIVLLLPMPVVWGLNLKRGQRWALMPIFCLGFVTCLISVGRLISFTRASADDFYYDVASVTVWGIAELASGLICSSLITLRPLARYTRPMFASLKNSAGSIRRRTLDFTLPRFRRSAAAARAGDGNTPTQTSSSGKPFENSETELTRHDDLELAYSAPTTRLGGGGGYPYHHGNSIDARLSGRSGGSSGCGAATTTMTTSNPRAQTTDDLPATTRHDRLLGLESGTRTVISSGDDEEDDDAGGSSFGSRSPAVSVAAIRVKRVWSVRDREEEEGPLRPGKDRKNNHHHHHHHHHLALAKSLSAGAVAEDRPASRRNAGL
ncbi:hypothetical protein F4780DRAFT_417901 [Xylariomycetidae sp. FL0641]|nr:hypothetical protein F4780DRAFT_417901 [Xylariomycetidae sp. FL0641]